MLTPSADGPVVSQWRSTLRKSNSSSSTVLNVPLSSIGTVFEENISREKLFVSKAKMEALASSFLEVTDGVMQLWDPSKGSAVVTPWPALDTKVIEERNAFEADLAEKVKAGHETEYKINGEKVTVTAEMISAAYRKVFYSVESKKKASERLAHQYLLVAGMRRTMTLILVVNPILVALDKDPITEIWSTIRIYSDDASRLSDCVKENLKFDQGREALSEFDKIMAGYRLFGKSIIMQRLEEVGFKHGMRQKLFPIYKLHDRYSIEGFDFLGQIGDGTIKFGPLKAADLTKWSKDPSIKLSDFISLLAEAQKKKTNADKIMAKEEIKRVADQNPVTFTKAIANAVHENRLDDINEFNDYASVMNKVVRLCRQGFSSVVEATLIALEKELDIEEEIATNPEAKASGEES